MANKLIQRIDGILRHIDTVQKEIGGISFDDFEFDESDFLITIKQAIDY